MKIYTIIAGVNGVGKSSLTGALKAQQSDFGIIIDADKISAKLKNPVAGGKATVMLIDDALKRGISFTQETTLSGKKTEKTIKRAIEAGYKIRLYYVGLNSREESLSRIKNRVAKGGHDIPREDVVRRFENRFKDLIKILPYCDEALFFDNENGFKEAAQYKNGELLTNGKNSPEWLRAFENELSDNPHIITL